MGFKKYLHRAHSKIPTSPSSFSSDESDSSFRRARRRSSRWKWSSTRSSRSMDGMSCDSGEETNSEGPANDNTSTDGGAPDDPPPISPLSSPELVKAMLYFEITLKRTFTREYVKKKYKRLSLIHHPDRNGNTEESIQEMQTINHYYDLLEEELDRLDEVEEDQNEEDPPIVPRTDSNSTSDTFNDDKDKDSKKEREGRTRRPSWRPSVRRRSASRRRSTSTEPSRRRSYSIDERRRRRRRTSVERRQRRKEREQERQDMEREMKREWDGNAKKISEFRKKLRKSSRWNNQRSIDLHLDSVWVRDQAFRNYTRQARDYRVRVASMRNAGAQEFTSNGSTAAPSKPNYVLMDCCNDEAVVAMRLGETGIAIDIIHQQIANTTDEWILLKMRASTSAKAGPGVYESSSKRGFNVQLDWSYYKRILQRLIRPLDEDGNSILHYAIYIEDDEVVQYLIQIARQNKIFAQLVVHTNNRNMNASDFAAGCTWNNTTIPTMIATLTTEAVGILDKKERRRAKRQQQERKPWEHPIAESLFHVFLCLAVGKYITCSGWIVSWIIIALAHVVELCNKSASSAFISKAFFFALHTGWFIAVGTVLKTSNIILTLAESIPIPWPLQLAMVSPIPFLVKVPSIHFEYMLRTTMKIESALISSLEWIMSQNETFSTGYTKHLVDYATLSVPFLAVRLFCFVNEHYQ